MFYYLAREHLDRDMFKKIDMEVGEWLGRPHQEIKRGTCEKTGAQKVAHNRKGQLRHRRNKSRFERDGDCNRVVYSDVSP
jgi:hypothetical protein